MFKDTYLLSGVSPVSRCVHEAAEEAERGHQHSSGPRYDQRPKEVLVLLRHAQNEVWMRSARSADKSSPLNIKTDTLKKM